MLPHYLRPLGYRCYQSGKWHVSGAPKPMADGGFDHSYEIQDHNRYFYPQQHEEDDQPLPPVEPGSDFYLTTYIADHAIRCLAEHAREHAAAPFVQYLAFTSPHFPLHALQEDIDRYRDRYIEGWDAIRAQRWKRQRAMGLLDCELSPREESVFPDWNLPPEELAKQIGPGEAARAVAWDTLTGEQKRFQATKMAIHAAMIDRMDREIGRVLDQVKAMGQYEDTVVLFVSDNGASAEQILRGDLHDPAAAPGSGPSYLCLGPGWSMAGNTPFRLHKHWNHEGGIASPLIVHWPAGNLDAGALRHSPGHFIDVIPTMLDLAGATPEPTWNGLTPPPFPGRSLVPALRREVDIEREYLFWSHAGNRALRQGKWKIVAAGEDGPWELYNLDRDRSETHDLAAKKPKKVEELAARWRECDRLFKEQAGPA